MNNRIIKFRVWDKELQEFSNYTNRDPFFDVSSGKIFFWERVQKNDGSYDADIVLEDNNKRFILQQFTGLLDKNGKEIFEGDIIKYPNDTPSLNSGFYTSAVKYEELNCRFGIGFELGGDYAEQDNVEVIGNIFENPELLK